jgi:hypothetical protein
MSNNMSVLQGGLLPLTVNQGDSDSVSATLILKEQTTEVVIEKTALYINGVADLTLDEDETDVVGVYDYQINEEYVSGAPDKYPDPDNCQGEFAFPTLTIYQALDEPEVS